MMRIVAALKDCNVVFVSGITLAIISPLARARLMSWLEDARPRGVRFAFDSNYRPALWEDAATARDWTEKFWRITDIAFPSVDDEMALFGDADTGAVLARFADYGVVSGALKAGETGRLCAWARARTGDRRTG